MDIVATAPMSVLCYKNCLIRRKSSKKTLTQSGRGTYSNKTWKRKADTEIDKSKKELAAFVEKQVKAGVKKAFATLRTSAKLKKASLTSTP